MAVGQEYEFFQCLHSQSLDDTTQESSLTLTGIVLINQSQVLIQYLQVKKTMWILGEGRDRFVHVESWGKNRIRD